MSDAVTAFAPASIGNVAVGFDMLGLALANVGDRVIACATAGTAVTIDEVRGLDGEIHPYLSNDPKENTASIASQSLWSDHVGAGGVELKIHNRGPVSVSCGSLLFRACRDLIRNYILSLTKLAGSTET